MSDCAAFTSARSRACNSTMTRQRVSSPCLCRSRSIRSSSRGFAGGNRAHIDRYFLALFVVSLVLAGATPVAQAEAAEPLPARGDGIRLDNVGFSYPSRPGTAALSGISLNVRPGEHVALVGPSGAGKTTLFQLLLRFYDPQAGSILINGVPTRDVPLAELRPDIGVVMQESVIFSGSVLDNIRYGTPEATLAQVQRAAEMAAATGFIEELPQCYDTFLGERGVRLSGGQPRPSRSPARS
jgi:ABC-type multidrug transport system fused ATPase/permease subunit